MTKRISIGSWAYTFGPYEANPIPLDVAVKQLGELGFDGIELGGFKPHAHPDLYPTKASREDLVAMLQDNGLGISGYAADLSGLTFAGGDPAIWAGYERWFDVNLQFCVDCGIKSIRVDTVNSPPLPPRVDYETAWERVVKMWRKIAPRAQDAGVLVVWEFEPGFMFNKPSEVVKLVEDIGHPNFKVLFDTCHAHMCSVIAARQPEPKETLPGGEVEFVKLLTGKIGHVHLIDSDNTLHDDKTSTHAPFGTGVINFDEVIPAIIQAEFPGEWWTIDLCFWPQAWEVTAQSKQFLRPLLEKYVK